MTKLMRRAEKTQPEDLAAIDPFRGGGLLRMDPFRMVREMFQDPFGSMGLLATEGPFRPELDIAETGDTFKIRVDLPGVDEENIEVQVTGNRLTVSGQRESEERSEGERYVAIERAYGSFTRSFVLPDSADLEHVEAELRNGVLQIKVPKRAEMKGRKVAIQAGSKAPELERGQEQKEAKATEEGAGAAQRKAA